jgi:hypothetical protein
MFPRSLDRAMHEAWSADTASDSSDEGREKALALDREIRSLARSQRRDRGLLHRRLRTMWREQLWKKLGKSSFATYAVEAGVMTSVQEARRFARLASRLEGLPAMRAVFDRGEADVSKVREAAPVVTPADDAEWAAKVVHLSCDEVRAEVKKARGEDPTGRLTLQVRLVTRDRFRAYAAAHRARRGESITNGEVLEHLLALGEAEVRAGATMSDVAANSARQAPGAAEARSSPGEEVRTTQPAPPAPPDLLPHDPDGRSGLRAAASLSVSPDTRSLELLAEEAIRALELGTMVIRAAIERSRAPRDGVNAEALVNVAAARAPPAVLAG